MPLADRLVAEAAGGIPDHLGRNYLLGAGLENFSATCQNASHVRILFLGLPLAACLLAADGHEIVYAGLSRTDTVGRRRLRRAIGDARVIDRPRLDRAFAERARSLAPDLVVSWFWTKLIPASVVQAGRLGGIGVHPSLLPRHRGPDPVTWAILAGDAVTGVTCHRLAPEYDTGAILDREELAIPEHIDAWRLARALDRPSLRVLRRVCARFAAGDPPPAVPQDESLATEAPFLEDAEQRIVWDAPTRQVMARIRALSPSPGAFTDIGGATVAVLRATPEPAPSYLEAPGEAAWIGGRALVRTQDGAVRLDVVERDGVPLEAAALEALLDARGS